mmetsp:Transcript_20872/g.50430  ORF Transcript_20872/g.50430 Transcript_20872/m.50430 type:complete len:209 (+) Transcript_20872:4300-4926(+)
MREPRHLSFPAAARGAGSGLCCGRLHRAALRAGAAQDGGAARGSSAASGGGGGDADPGGDRGAPVQHCGSLRPGFRSRSGCWEPAAGGGPGGAGRRCKGRGGAERWRIRANGGWGERGSRHEEHEAAGWHRDGLHGRGGGSCGEDGGRVDRRSAADTRGAGAGAGDCRGEAAEHDGSQGYCAAALEARGGGSSRDPGIQDQGVGTGPE